VLFNNMTWEILWISTSFRYNDIRLYQAQLIATITVWIWALIWAIYIWRKQVNISKYQTRIASIRNKISWLTQEIVIGQSKLEHTVNILIDAEDKWNKEEVKQILEVLEWLKTSLNDLYKSRNETMDIYDKVISKK
jgi:hypothetical protein